MNITQEKIDDHSALLKVQIEPQDYHQRYDNALKNYRRQLQLPGFRAGKVPMGMVKSRFGKSLLADELNKVLNDSIQGYIAENKIKVLGSPIPSEQHDETGNWDNPAEFEFYYEMGLAPKLDVSLTAIDKIDYFTIKVDDKMLEDHLKDVTERNGELADETETAKDRLIMGEFVELEEDGEVKPAGIFTGVNFRLLEQDEETLEKLSGLRIGDKVVVDPRKAFASDARLAKAFGIDKASVTALHPHFQLTVKEIKWMKPAELNQELFDKVFGEGAVDSEEAFRERLRKEIAQNFIRESEQLFKRDITRYMIEKFNPELPDSFLKRWIRMTNEKPISAEEIERDYHEYKKGLQWQLIFNELIGSKDIEVEKEEVLERAKSMLAAQYAQYGIPAPADEELEASALRILAKEDQSRGIYDALYDEKLNAYVKANATVQEKEVSFDEFVEKANN